MSYSTMHDFVAFHGQRLLINAEDNAQHQEKTKHQHAHARAWRRRYRSGMYGALLLLIFVSFITYTYQETEFYSFGWGTAISLLLMVVFCAYRRDAWSSRSWKLQEELNRFGRGAPHAEQGDVTAEMRLSQALDEGPEQWVLLGDAIMEGNGFCPDTNVALALWAMASDAGCSLGAYRMGVYYKRRMSTESYASGWFYRAAALGSERALGELNETRAVNIKPVHQGRGGRDFVLEHFGLTMVEDEPPSGYTETPKNEKDRQ